MFIRCLQYTSLLVIFFPLLSVSFKFWQLSILENGIIFLSSSLCILLSLLVRLQIPKVGLVKFFPLSFSICLFLILLWNFALKSSHFLLALYFAGVHVFTFHWLLTGRYPMKIEPWQDKNKSGKALLIFSTSIQAIFLPFLITWLVYFILFPSDADKEHVSAILFYIGVPMTFVGIVFALIYMCIAYFFLREPKTSD